MAKSSHKESKAADLVSGIINSSHVATVNEGSEPRSNATEPLNQLLSKDAFQKPDGSAGKGVDVLVTYNPEDPESDIKNADGSYGRPSIIGLLHEFIHTASLFAGRYQDDPEMQIQLAQKQRVSQK